MDWQIAGPIIGVLISILVSVVLYYFSHKEKLEIKYSNMNAQLKINDATGIQVDCAFSLLYMKGTRDCYVSEIWLELDKHLWKKLKPYFEVYLKISRGFSQDKLPKLELGKPQCLGVDMWFPARRVFSEEERKEIDDIVQKLWHRYKIGWKDTYGKVHWKTVHQLREIRRWPTMN